MTSTPIPENVEFEGVKIPTDVVQRSFKPNYNVVALQALGKDFRKQRQDTLVPGLSIGNRRTTDAGTLGTMVLDTKSRQAAILSNWHVLHTPTGQIGDEIVQPGPFDDNRTDRNVIGHLVRSHLGAAGDCAICSIESRNIESQILELKTIVGRIGKAELDDVVVKSGRTTGVTWGVVTRVETVTKMNYGGKIENIGGFEIGIDGKHPPADGEISKGGDSGSCWMAIGPKGHVTDVMLGLHFAGDAEGSDAEFALACNAHSVFEKLEIAPLTAALSLPPATEAAVRADLRTGFDRDFLQFGVPEVRLTDSLMTDLASLDARREIKVLPFLGLAEQVAALSAGRRLEHRRRQHQEDRAIGHPVREGRARHARTVSDRR